jgi:ARG and Rhodanese-Phosphatase-superfamily-associated Protein domain
MDWIILGAYEGKNGIVVVFENQLTMDITSRLFEASPRPDTFPGTPLHKIRVAHPGDYEFNPKDFLGKFSGLVPNEPVSIGYPLLSTYSLDLEYLLLDEALNENLIEIIEKDSDGSVPELRVTNKSTKMILILDGEELVGAKQNRIVNTTILIQGNDTVVIPVSCVEHGRWSYDSPQFHSKERMMSSNLRAMKSEQVNYSIRSSGEFRSDQSAIWDGIAKKANRMGRHLPPAPWQPCMTKKGPLSRNM